VNSLEIWLTKTDTCSLRDNVMNENQSDSNQTGNINKQEQVRGQILIRLEWELSYSLFCEI